MLKAVQHSMTLIEQHLASSHLVPPSHFAAIHFTKANIARGVKSSSLRLSQPVGESIAICTIGQGKWQQYRGFPKWGYPQIIHFHGIFHYKPTILGYPHLWNPPYTLVDTVENWNPPGLVYASWSLSTEKTRWTKCDQHLPISNHVLLVK